MDAHRPESQDPRWKYQYQCPGGKPNLKPELYDEHQLLRSKQESR